MIPGNTRLVQSIPGVAIAYPIVITGGKATFPDGSNTAISLIGSDAPLFKAGPMQKNIIEGSFDNLLNEGAVTADYYDR
ncbi:MAG: ABC transporter permease, partial [Chitinophagaceae bacterium]|nr:ABC transporter permease [Chitinophagaceae bacterium]